MTINKIANFNNYQVLPLQKNQNQTEICDHRNSVLSERFPKGLTISSFTGKIPASLAYKNSAIKELQIVIDELPKETAGLPKKNKKQIVKAMKLVNESLAYLKETNLTKSFRTDKKKMEDLEANFTKKIFSAQRLVAAALPFSQRKMENILCHLPGSDYHISMAIGDQGGANAAWHVAKDIGCAYQDFQEKF